MRRWLSRTALPWVKSAPATFGELLAISAIVMCLLFVMVDIGRPDRFWHLIPPLGIATRQSTDVLVIEDRNVARAIHYIRQNACNGIQVKDVLRVVPQSRTLLESRFKRLIGRTPHEEILRVRLNRWRGDT